MSQPGSARRAVIGLGANLGDARATLDAACQAIWKLPGTARVGLSSWYCSAPVDAQGPDFLNAVAVVDTDLTPLALLDALQAIEMQHGRARPYRNAPRTLDLDLLLFGDATLHSARLILPHPRWLERAFVLLPWLELCSPDELLAMPALSAALAGAGLHTPEALSMHAVALAVAQRIECLPQPGAPEP